MPAVRKLVILVAMSLLACLSWGDCRGLPAAGAKPDKEPDDSSSELGAMFDKAVEKGSAPTRVMDRWFALYSHGQLKEADQVWSDILISYKDKVDIADLLDAVNQRCWFGESPGKKLEAIKIFQYLLGRTQKMLGTEHQFVGDIMECMAAYYEPSHDFARALDYRRLDLKCHTRAFGPEHWKVLEDEQRLGHLLIKMKKYAQAETVLKTAIDGARRHSNVHVMLSSLPDYINVLQAEGKLEEAKGMRSEYMKWRRVKLPVEKPGAKPH